MKFVLLLGVVLMPTVRNFNGADITTCDRHHPSILSVASLSVEVVAVAVGVPVLFHKIATKVVGRTCGVFTRVSNVVVDRLVVNDVSVQWLQPVRSSPSKGIHDGRKRKNMATANYMSLRFQIVGYFRVRGVGRWLLLSFHHLPTQQDVGSLWKTRRQRVARRCYDGKKL